MGTSLSRQQHIRGPAVVPSTLPAPKGRRPPGQQADVQYSYVSPGLWAPSTLMAHTLCSHGGLLGASITHQFQLAVSLRDDGIIVYDTRTQVGGVLRRSLAVNACTVRTDDIKGVQE